MCRGCNMGWQAFGTHADPAKSHNPAARKVIMAVKKVVEHIRKSPKAKVSCLWRPSYSKL